MCTKTKDPGQHCNVVLPDESFDGRKRKTTQSRVCTRSLKESLVGIFMHEAKGDAEVNAKGREIGEGLTGIREKETNGH